MIIYPQVNSLKIVILPAFAILIILGIYSYKSYTSLEEFDTYLTNENDAVASELFDMIVEYHNLEVDNDSLKIQLDISREKITRILDSVQSLEPNIALVTNYKKQLQVLKNENKKILKLVEKLHYENEILKLEADYYANALDQSEIKLSKYQASASKLYNVNNKLKQKNEGLSDKIDEASLVFPKITLVEAVRRIKSDNSIVTTDRARRTRKLNVSIKIPENKLAEKGNRSYYMQVIDPNSNVVGDRGSVTIRNRETLIKSKEITIDYQNDELAVNYFIEQNENEEFVKGVYHVGLYDNQGLIENTTFTLQ
ncbi:hypothetical protein [Lacinutrix chionoecetis]